MTLAHLKATLTVRLIGESKAVGDGALIKTILGDVLNRIANTCTPLSLLTRDIVNNVPLRQLDESYYIMKPTVPTLDTDEINIDASLELAVIYLMCASIARAPNQPFVAMAQEVIDAHKWTAYEYLSKKEIVDELHGGW